MDGRVYRRWSHRLTRVLLAIVMLAVGVGIGAGAMVVAQPGNDTFFACLTKGGDLVKVRLNSVPTSGSLCSSDQTAVTWSEQGVPGQDGVSGYEVVQGTTVDIPAGAAPMAVTATCPEGKVATGGGVVTFGFNGADAARVAASSILPGNSGWFARVANDGNVTFGAHAHAICVTVGAD